MLKEYQVDPNNIEGWTKKLRKKQTQKLTLTQRPKPHFVNLSTNQRFLATKTKPTHYISTKMENEIQNEFSVIDEKNKRTKLKRN